MPPLRACCASGSRAARCRKGRAATRASVGTTRAAAATASSGPTTRAAAASAAAMSRSSWSAAATVEAMRKSTKPAWPRACRPRWSRARWHRGRSARREDGESGRTGRRGRCRRPVLAGGRRRLGCRLARVGLPLAGPESADPSGWSDRRARRLRRVRSGTSGSSVDRRCPGGGTLTSTASWAGPAVPAAARRDPGAGPGRHQRQVGLVLDLLTAGEGQRRPGIAVEEEAGRLGQQLGVGRVTPVDRDIDGAMAEPSREPAHAPLLNRDGGHFGPAMSRSASSSVISVDEAGRAASRR